jgi:hypothetical protein
MTEVSIYKPAKTAMQSGRGNTRKWVIEFEPGANFTEPLMGWIGSTDTQGQVQLRFGSKQEAITFADKNGLAYRLQEPKPRRIRPKSYAENFSFRRRF